MDTKAPVVVLIEVHLMSYGFCTDNAERTKNFGPCQGVGEGDAD